MSDLQNVIDTIVERLDEDNVITYCGLIDYSSDIFYFTVKITMREDGQLNTKFISEDMITTEKRTVNMVFAGIDEVVEEIKENWIR